MKAALLISGYLRTIKTNLVSIKEKVIDKFDICDVYLHVTKNENKQDRYVNLIDDATIKEVIDFLQPVVALQEDNQVYSKDKNENVLYNTWMKYHKLNKLKQITETTKNTYDVVIKYRPDCSLFSDIPFELATTNYDTIFIPKEDKMDTCKLNTIDDPHICDIFAFGSSKVMDRYFPDYGDIEAGIKSVGTVPETFLAHHLLNTNYKQLDIDYGVILSNCNIFAIAGDSGSGKSTLATLLRDRFQDSFLLECDRYHKWERGNEMWKQMTHLNPESNFLTKMREDIFDLKIGNTVFQVDYDHKNGKFTEKEAIPSKDNMIVCGLHSLYLKNDKLYNLMIFMDTDKALKYKWKIRRDIKKRGYSVQKIWEQIESRVEDYKKYIEPQKEQSDIVVKFYTDHEFSLQDVEKQDNVGLKLLINKTHDISHSLRFLDERNINYSLEEKQDRMIVTFPCIPENEENMKLYYGFVLLFVFDVRN